MENLFHCFLYIIVIISGVFGNHPNNNTGPTTVNPLSQLLSKFHQNDYKLFYERCDLVRSDTSFGEFHVRTYKYNRSTPVVNGSFIFTQNLGYDVEVISQQYKFASNEYRLFPVRFELNFCSAIASGAMGLNGLSTSGNFTCPLLKGKKYHFNKFTPDESTFPPLIPDGRYMLEFQFLYHSQEILVIENYGTIYRPIAIP